MHRHMSSTPNEEAENTRLERRCSFGAVRPQPSLSMHRWRRRSVAGVSSKPPPLIYVEKHKMINDKINDSDTHGLCSFPDDGGIANGNNPANMLPFALDAKSELQSEHHRLNDDKMRDRICAEEKEAMELDAQLKLAEWNKSRLWQRNDKASRRRRSKRERLLDSITWFSLHVPQCVMNDLIYLEHHTGEKFPSDVEGALDDDDYTIIVSEDETMSSENITQQLNEVADDACRNDSGSAISSLSDEDSHSDTRKKYLCSEPTHRDTVALPQSPISDTNITKYDDNATGMRQSRDGDKVNVIAQHVGAEKVAQSEKDLPPFPELIGVRDGKGIDTGEIMTGNRSLDTEDDEILKAALHFGSARKDSCCDTGVDTGDTVDASKECSEKYPNDVTQGCSQYNNSEEHSINTEIQKTFPNEPTLSRRKSPDRPSYSRRGSMKHFRRPSNDISHSNPRPAVHRRDAIVMGDPTFLEGTNNGHSLIRVRSRRRSLMTAMTAFSSSQGLCSEQTEKMGTGAHCKPKEETYQIPSYIQANNESAQQTNLQVPDIIGRDSALLFVDIKGFTQLSTSLDVDTLSEAINSYFELIVNEVLSHGGDVLKFAGDALFAEWQSSADEEFPHCNLNPVDEDTETKSGRLDSKDDDVLKGKTNKYEIDLSSISEAHDSNVCRRNRIGDMKNDAISRSEVSSCMKDVSLKSSSIFEGSANPRNIVECVKSAASCGTSIVEKCSDLRIPGTKFGTPDVERIRKSNKNDTRSRKLNVHCGLGVGHLVSLHVEYRGNVSKVPTGKRREFLFLGDPINQTSKATERAADGEVVASPEAIDILCKSCTLSESITSKREPKVIASRSKRFFTINQQRVHRNSSKTLANTIGSCSKLSVYDTIRGQCEGMDTPTLISLRHQLSLYVHPVVRGDEFSIFNRNKDLYAEPPNSRKLSRRRQRDEAELRSVYVMFISPMMNANLSGNEELDSELITQLSNVMHVVSHEVNRFSGHLRQFIVDDKGVVLIATFGLRGSARPNMIIGNALPATLSIYSALKKELHLDCRIGATFDKAYCGVVGGVLRHEFAVLGPSVNLAARLMSSLQNPGILVDEKVQMQAKTLCNFRSLPPVKAKGYAKLVPIYEPLDIINKQIGDTTYFVGRENEVTSIVQCAAKKFKRNSASHAEVVTIEGESGSGKSALISFAVKKIKHMCAVHKKLLLLSRTECKDCELLVPFSALRKTFLHAISESCLFDRTTTASFQRDNKHPIRFSFTSMESSSGIQNRVSCLEKVRQLSNDLGFAPEYADVIGSRLLGLDDANGSIYTVGGKVPSMGSIIEFLTQLFVSLLRHVDLMVVILDDVHWMDSLSWGVIQSLCKKEGKLIFLCASRKHGALGTRWLSSLQKNKEGIVFTEISLGPLKISEIKVLISEVLGAKENKISDQFCRDVYELTGGIPIFATDLLQNIKRNNLVCEDSSGITGFQATSSNEQLKSEPNDLAVFEERFLHRFDSLELPVRKVLQSCAVLGLEFSLSDVLQINPEYESLHILQKLLDSAVCEHILVEHFRDVDEDDFSSVVQDHIAKEEGTTCEDLAHGCKDPIFRFRHAMWRKSILKTMLKDRKKDLHRMIAVALEASNSFSVEQSDTGMLLRVFDHWRLSNNFDKAAPLALAIGKKLEEWGPSQQSLDLYGSTLAMIKEPVEHRQKHSVVTKFHSSELTVLTVPSLDCMVRLQLRIVKCFHCLGEEKRSTSTLMDAYSVLMMPSVQRNIDKMLLFLVYSNICINLLDGFRPDEDDSFVEDVVLKFVSESQKLGDPVHICQALALQSLFYAYKGNVECALRVQAGLQRVYSVCHHSALLVHEYGHDYAAISLSHSAQWYDIAGEEKKALVQAEAIVHTILPKVYQRDADNLMKILFPSLMVLKMKGMVLEAKDAMEKTLTIDTKLLELDHSASYWSILHTLTSYLLEIVQMDTESKHQMAPKSLQEVKSSILQPEHDQLPPAQKNDAKIIIAEICWRLAMRLRSSDPNWHFYIEKGIELLDQVLCTKDRTSAFMLGHATEVRESLGKMKIQSNSTKFDDQPRITRTGSCIIA